MEANIDEFEEGFERPESEESEDAGAEQQPEQAEQAQHEFLPEPPARQYQLEPQYPEAEQPKRIGEIPGAIADEFENLKNLNPRAAELALEDSAEGVAIRKRLESYGAEQAQDRAEMILYKRDQEQATALAWKKQEQARRAADAEYFRQGAPDFYALMNDPGRANERDRYLGNLRSWIGTKSFREGSELMQVYQSGRPDQVCRMIEAFEKEKAGRRQDAADMFAVPSRGRPSMPQGAGDKDDFDAGWNLHQ